MQSCGQVTALPNDTVRPTSEPARQTLAVANAPIGENFPYGFKGARSAPMARPLRARAQPGKEPGEARVAWRARRAPRETATWCGHSALASIHRVNRVSFARVDAKGAL